MKNLVGVVRSNKMEKTAVVAVEIKKPHRVYRKIVKKTKRYKAGTGDFTVEIGDKVVMRQTRPVSREKRWLIVKVLKREKEGK